MLKKSLTQFFVSCCLFVLCSLAIADTKQLPLNNLSVLQVSDSLAQFFKHYQPGLSSHSKPLLIEAHGANNLNQSIKDAQQINRWECIFVTADEEGNNPKTLFVSFDKGEFKKIQLHDNPWLGTEFVSLLTVEMDLETAIETLRKAGYTDNFLSVVLRKPLVPSAKEIYYMFLFRGYTVFVGTESGHVSIE